MTTTAKQLLDQAMALDESDRIEFADRLVESLEPTTDNEYLEAWDREIASRLDDIDSGRAKMISGDESIRMIREQAGCDADENS